jgi:serine/threonine protein kinase
VALTVGTRLGTYEVLAAISAGGMGEVYHARDAKLNRDVALRSCRKTLRSIPTGLQSSC